MNPVTGDNCGVLSVNNDAPATFPVENTTVTWTVNDIHGNVKTCQQTVTVTDNELPTIICPADVSVSNDPGQCYATVTLVNPLAVITAECCQSATMPLRPSGWNYYVTVNDIRGNVKTCQQTVTVTDKELPTITCPANVSVNNDPGQCYATYTLVNLSPVITVVCCQ